MVEEKKKSDGLPIAGKVVINTALDDAIKDNEHRTDEQGILITKQLKETKRILDGECAR